MKLLFDQNLAASLSRHFMDHYPGSAHLQDLGLERASDIAIWNIAKLEGYTLVSKDSDFVDLQAALGFPPKVVWIIAGNVTTAQIRVKLDDAEEALARLDLDPSLGLLELA